MVKSTKSDSCKKCEPSQEKIAFKEAYRVIRSLYKSTANTSPNDFDDFSSAIDVMIEAMPVKRAIPFSDAKEAWISREGCYKTVSRIQSYLYRKEVAELAEIIGQGKAA